MKLERSWLLSLVGVAPRAGPGGRRSRQWKGRLRAWATASTLYKDTADAECRVDPGRRAEVARHPHEWQRQLETIRPLFPTHAPVEETELAGKLVRHTGKLKTIIDVIRVVCANAESELAAALALHMRSGVEDAPCAPTSTAARSRPSRPNPASPAAA